jgi:hypothetical protein
MNREREEMRDVPSPAGALPEPLAMLEARRQRREVQICARAATVEEVVAAAELPVTAALPVDRTRECRWGACGWRRTS